MLNAEPTRPRGISVVFLFAAWSMLGCEGRPKPAPIDSRGGAQTLARAASRCADRESVTFFVASDTHFGAGQDVEARDVELVRQMNQMQGSPWPEALGGTIDEACGVLVSGDLTEDGRPEEWERFVAAFGLNGGDGALSFPVFETLGNHDKHQGTFIRDRITERHGGVVYSFDWGPVHVVSLGEAPDGDDLRWLADDLGRVAPDRHIVLYFHFPLEGAYSTGQWFGDGPYRDALAETIKGKPIAAIFHGHYHAAGLYEWRDFDVYRAGSPKHKWHTYTVVQIDAKRFRAASWDYDAKKWVWWHEKPIGGGEGREIRYGDPALPP